MRAVAFVVAATVLATLAAASGAGPDDSETVSPTTVSAAETVEQGREPAPAIKGVYLEGESISLGRLPRPTPADQRLVIVVKQLPQSEAVAYAEFVDDHPQVEYLGIDVADTTDEGRGFVAGYQWSWPRSIQDPERMRARLLGADYQPHFILDDAKGRIADTIGGPRREAVWETMLARLP